MGDFFEHWDAIDRGDKERLGAIGDGAAVLGRGPGYVLRAAPRIVVRVVAEPHVCGVGQYQLHRGVNLLVIYEDELRDFERACATPLETQRRADAIRAYEMALRQHAKNAHGWIEGSGSMQNEAAFEAARATFGRSPESIMSDLENGTGAGPKDAKSCKAWTGWSKVTSVEVLGFAPPPETHETRRQAEHEQLVRALTQATGGGNASVDALMRRIDDLEAKLAQRDKRAKE